jgi:hypothetical protein
MLILKMQRVKSGQAAAAAAVLRLVKVRALAVVAVLVKLAVMRVLVIRLDFLWQDHLKPEQMRLAVWGV